MLVNRIGGDRAFAYDKAGSPADPFGLAEVLFENVVARSISVVVQQNGRLAVRLRRLTGCLENAGDPVASVDEDEIGKGIFQVLEGSVDVSRPFARLAEHRHAPLSGNTHPGRKDSRFPRGWQDLSNGRGKEAIALDGYRRHPKSIGQHRTSPRAELEEKLGRLEPFGKPGP